MKYPGAVIPVLVLAMVASCAGPVKAQAAREPWSGQQADNRTDFSKRLLEAHNHERSQLGQAELAWNATLAAHAQVWAQAMADRGVMAHSAATSRPGEGENLWMGTAGAYRLEEMIGHFIDERRDFRAGIFPDVARSGRWESVGHYTQIIWPTTREVGCALATGGGHDWLVCRYAPAGNVVGERVP